MVGPTRQRKVEKLRSEQCNWKDYTYANEGVDEVVEELVLDVKLECSVITCKGYNLTDGDDKWNAF